MAEIYFIKGENDKALEHFDRCEIILDKLDHLGALDQLNHFRVKIKLAYIYWLLGYEYTHITLEKIDEAKNIYDQNKHLFDDPEQKYYELLLNDLCAYYLENYIKTKKEEEEKEKEKRDEEKIKKIFDEAEKRLHDLEKFMESRLASANILDTMAWFYYHIYLGKKDKAILERAKRLCRLMGERENYSTYKLTSLAIQANHIQVIMSAK